MEGAIEMIELIITGKQKIGSIEFTGIEGGFGEDKKAMLIKDIARIHGKQVKHVNEAINANLKRFKTGTDIIDILGVGEIDPKDFGYSKQAVNAYKGLKKKGLQAGIYLLSERGYAKLLKILEDDAAWEIYEQLVDGYFHMRQEITGLHGVFGQYNQLAVMAENAKTRKAQVLYRVAMVTESQEIKEWLLSYIIRLLTGKTLELLKKED